MVSAVSCPIDSGSDDSEAHRSRWSVERRELPVDLGSDDSESHPLRWSVVSAVSCPINRAATTASVPSDDSRHDLRRSVVSALSRHIDSAGTAAICDSRWSVSAVSCPIDSGSDDSEAHPEMERGERRELPNRLGQRRQLVAPLEMGVVEP